MNKTKIIIFALLTLMMSATATYAAVTNVTLLYGWNGTSWIPMKTSSDGTLQSDLNITDSLSINPKTDNTYDLGSSSLRWRDLYATRNTYLATTSGLVGIGTSSPISTLDVSGNLSVSGSTNSSIDGSTFFVDATNNRIGIGTTSPASLLHVTGSATNLLNVSNSTYSFLSVNTTGTFIGG
ncbi:MAG: hypothetical protein HYW22_02555, partial [Candidatus Aenigmarchaeota archaeon]|nr:hypothetical protein [Candidatus Aenigmarchaeota archaeon]